MQTQKTFNWDVKIDDTLRKPVTVFAVQAGKEIREIVTQAVTEYMQKQENLKVGE